MRERARERERGCACVQGGLSTRAKLPLRDVRQFRHFAIINGERVYMATCTYIREREREREREWFMREAICLQEVRETFTTIR